MRLIRALSVARGGVVHAMHFRGSKRGFCGWKRFNFNKVISLVPMEWGDGHRYIPPTDVYPTCILCVTEAFA